MKEMRKYDRDQGTVFVVTRDRNFKDEFDAKDEAHYWIGICRQYDPKSKVSIVKTDKPRKIR